MERDSREVHWHVSREEGLSDAKPMELRKEVKGEDTVRDPVHLPSALSISKGEGK